MKATPAQLLVAGRREHEEADPPVLEEVPQRVVPVAAGARVKVEQVPGGNCIKIGIPGKLILGYWVAIQLAKIWLEFWLQKRLEIPF